MNNAKTQAGDAINADKNDYFCRQEPQPRPTAAPRAAGPQAPKARAAGAENKPKTTQKHMPQLSLTTFFNGVSTAYFAINACQLLARRQRTRLQTLLGAICAYWALTTAKDLAALLPHAYTPRMLDAIQVADGWSAITFACLLFELTTPGWVNARRVALTALPFALLTALYTAMPSHTMATVYMAFLALFGATVIRIGYARAEIYTAYLYTNFSDIDNMDISWLKKLYVAGFAYMLLWVVVSVVRHPAADSLIYLAGIAFWQLTIHFCDRLRPVVPEPYDDGADIKAAPNPRDFTFAGRMESMVENDRLYLDPKLSLRQLAERLGTNRTYLSQYFNEVKGVTFYDYINAMRINKKSVPLMQEHPEYTLDYVAKQSGFNSLSTFRRAFRKYTGTTPGCYAPPESPSPNNGDSGAAPMERAENG